MRAEAQASVDQINQAMALVRRFLDWDRALRRLDELNNRVEDPKLWDDAKAAQDVMRERRRLDEAVAAVKAIEQERDDTVELMELAEAEGDPQLAKVFGRLAAVEEAHAQFWRNRLRAMGKASPQLKPGFRTRALGWLARRFGPLEIEMAAISNVRKDGSLRSEEANDDVMKVLKGNMGWHADSTYMPVQAKEIGRAHV